MEKKSWKEMDGWEKAWEVTKKIALGGAAVVLWFLTQGGRGSAGRRGSPGGQGGSVWTVGSGGKKSGSWSSGRHR